MQPQEHPNNPKRIAVVGAGISGLTAAWLLGKRHIVDLYEAGHNLGGHCHTCDVAFGNETKPIDTGVIVYNTSAYPNFFSLLRYLDINHIPADFSGTISLNDGKFNYSVPRILGVMSHPRTVAQIRFWRMLLEILRFNRIEYRQVASSQWDDVTIGEFLDVLGYSKTFQYNYLAPLACIIWVCTPRQALSFPAQKLIQLFKTFGLMQFRNPPTWRSIDGSTRKYIAKLERLVNGSIFRSASVTAVKRSASGIGVKCGDGQKQMYENVIIATHADQALSILADPSEQENTILSAFSYSQNRDILHRDVKVMPHRSSQWSSWNYMACGSEEGEKTPAVTYWINRILGIDQRFPVFSTLNPSRIPDSDLIINDVEFHHPRFDTAAIKAQKNFNQIQGVRGTWYCGGYFGLGSHEHALCSGIAVAEAFGITPPWLGNNAD
jgi:predicted NAD/FAD-binding protein